MGRNECLCAASVLEYRAVKDFVEELINAGVYEEELFRAFQRLIKSVRDVGTYCGVDVSSELDMLSRADRDVDMIDDALYRLEIEKKVFSAAGKRYRERRYVEPTRPAY
jgi:hypothetical protein